MMTTALLSAQNYLYLIIIQAIAKCAESLLLSVTQKVTPHATSCLIWIHRPKLFVLLQINVFALDCQRRSKDKYVSTVELILGAASQIREEVSAMEVDILVSENMTELLERTRPQMETVVHEVHMATLAASSQPPMLVMCSCFTLECSLHRSICS